MFLVSGITGHVGGAAARRLLEQGKQVRGLTRDPEKASAWAAQGVELRQGGFNDAAALASALQDVEGAFLMMPPSMTPSPGFPESKGIVAGYRQALAQAPPAKLVLLSSIGSEQPSGLGLITSTHLMEEALSGLPFPTAFVRAGSFLENYAFSLQSAASTGFFDSFYQPLDKPIPMIATQDIGNEVARLLTTSWTGKRIIELGTPYTPLDIAQALGEALGREVQARGVPRERWTSIIESMGLPPGSTGPYEEMLDSVNSGWIHHGVPGTESVPGTLTPREFFTAAAANV